MTLTLGSLFDGIGGFPLAAMRQGITPLWASEIEPFPIQVTKHHFPEMLHVGDITRLDGAKLPPVDIICGGSPCQDLSVASCTRAGLAGVRSGLFLEQIRVTKEMRNADVQRGRAGKSVRPRWFCWENVPGVFSSGYPKGADFQLVLQQIIGINCGAVFIPRPHPWGWQPAGRILLGSAFSLAWRVFDAQYWPGTPSGDAGCSLSLILQDNPPRKYYLTRRACLGILRRAGSEAAPSRPSSTGRCWYRLGWPVRMRAALRGHQALRLDFPPERGPARAASGTRSARPPPEGQPERQPDALRALPQ